MCHNKKINNNKLLYYKKQAGSTLVIAIFIIVVLSSLGAALVRVLDSSQQSVAFEVLGTRAYTTAQFGLQWQLAQVFPLAPPAQARRCADVSTTPPSLANVDGLKGCSVSVSCNDFQHSGVTYYTITATGQCDIEGEKTSRTVEVEARSL